jgi:hypothetical protein
MFVRMKKTDLKLIKKKIVLEAPHILRHMRNDLSPKKYQEFINFLDYYMMDELKIRRDQIPWLNRHFKRTDWKIFIGLLRLIVAKFWHSWEQQHYRHTKH